MKSSILVIPIDRVHVLQIGSRLAILVSPPKVSATTWPHSNSLIVSAQPQQKHFPSSNLPFLFSQHLSRMTFGIEVFFVFVLDVFGVDVAGVVTMSSIYSSGPCTSG